MNLRSLEFFLTVAEEGSISHAAERLHISQPTVSRDMMELERELGKNLFIRTSKNVSLTPDGLLFRETARDMLALYQKAVTQKADPAELAGDIYLGAGETESFHYLAEEIHSFRQKYPKVCFHIISENADEIRDDIDKGTLDFGFVMKSGSFDRYGCLEIARQECWGVLVPEDHPLAAREWVRGKELLEYPLILPENKGFRQQIAGWLEGEPRTAATYNLIRNALYLVKNGTGLVLCLSDPVFEQNGLRFVPLKPARKVSPVLIWRSRRSHTPEAEAFLNHLGYSEYE